MSISSTPGISRINTARTKKNRTNWVIWDLFVPILSFLLNVHSLLLFPLLLLFAYIHFFLVFFAFTSSFPSLFHFVNKCSFGFFSNSCPPIYRLSSFLSSLPCPSFISLSLSLLSFFPPSLLYLLLSPLSPSPSSLPSSLLSPFLPLSFSLAQEQNSNLSLTSPIPSQY